MQEIDPSWQIEAKSYALDLARMSMPAVAVRQAQVRIEAVRSWLTEWQRGTRRILMSQSARARCARQRG